jgi:hypothetical protein
MNSNFKIDQAATFAGLVFLSCEPKLDFNTKQQQMTKGDNPLPKWEIQVLGAVRDQFGQTSNEVVKVGIASRTNPAESIAPFTPVSLSDLEVGVMERTKKVDGVEKVIGVTVWFRCTEILNAAETVLTPAAA